MNFLHSDVMSSKLLFYRTIEDHYGVVAQYYQLPWLSVRDAVWQGLVNGWEGFKLEEILTHSEQHGHLPNELGHRYMADLAVALIQQAFVEKMLQPFNPAGEVLEAVHDSIILATRVHQCSSFNSNNISNLSAQQQQTATAWSAILHSCHVYTFHPAILKLKLC